ncbi:MAG: YdcF family protein [Sulfuricaulis sp.]
MVDVGPKILALWLVPPGVIVVVAVLGFIVQIRWLLLGSLVTALSIMALLILSLPLTGQQLMEGVESRYAPLDLGTLSADTTVGAIVILGGGRYTDAAEYGGGDNVNRVTLECLRYGAYLHRLTGLPVLVSGGAPYGEKIPEAELMQTALKRDFQTEARWVENKSANTFENAEFSLPILSGAGVKRIYLVTQAAHMARAVWSFEDVGIDVVPAPMGFSTLGRGERASLGYYPSARGLWLSSTALHERLGLMWYRHKYGSGQAPSVTVPGTAK